MESGALFQRTTVPAAKPVPVTVNWKDGPPATAEAGERLLIVSGGGVIVKVSAEG